MKDTRHRTGRTIVCLLLCAAAILLSAGCGGGEQWEKPDLHNYEEDKYKTIAIEPQVVFDERGCTLTVKSYKVTENILTLFATADNTGSDVIRSMSGNAFFNDVAVGSSLILNAPLQPGAKDVECDLNVYLDPLICLGADREMIGGELRFLFRAYTAETSGNLFYVTGTLTLPEAKKALPALDVEGTPFMVYCNGRRDYTLEYLCEHRFEDGTLALCIRVINHADEPLFMAGTFTGINGVEFSRKKTILDFLGADSTGLACLYLTVSNCVACGIEDFGDIDYFEHIQRRYLSNSDILSTYPGTYRIFEYREDDAHPLAEKIVTDRGVVRVDAKRFSSSRMIFEVRVDGATVTDPSLFDDIGAMAFISGDWKIPPVPKGLYASTRMSCFRQ